MSALALLASASHVRLAALRQPYRRAGIAIAQRGVFTIVPREQLDADRAIALLLDPVVQFAVAQDDDDWRELTEEERQDAAMEIERNRLSVAVVSDDPAALDRAIVKALGGTAVLLAHFDQLLTTRDAWQADQRHLHDQGYQTLEALTDAWAVDRAAINGATDQVAALQAANQQLSDELVKAEGAASDRQAQIADLQAALDKAKKPAAKAKAADE